MRDKYSVWKWLILVSAVSFSLVLVTPPSKKIRQGIDLKGGTSITVELDINEIRTNVRDRMPAATDEEVQAEVDKVLRGAEDRSLEVIRNRVDNLGISEPIIYPTKGHRIVVQLPGADAKAIEQAEQAIKRAAYLQFRIVNPDNARLVDDLYKKRMAPEGYRLETVGNGNGYVIDESFPATQRTQAYRERLGKFGVKDPADEFMLEKNVIEGREIYQPHFVRRRPELTGEYLKDASVDTGQMGQFQVQLSFDGKGAKKFYQVTSDYAPGGARNPNPNEYVQLAIVLDGTLYSAPRINDAIAGGRAQIEGRFSFKEATDLSNILRAGSLPAPVTIVEKRTVSPSLGSDSIHSGVRAAMYGTIAVFVFMAIYYQLAGLIANLSLIVLFILLPLGMVVSAGVLGIFARDSGGGGSLSLPVLTLPGIAGIALTIGMAVDSSVLIFERIREELAGGKRLTSAIDAGFDRAFVTILDTHITTLLSAVIMFAFGSGPIRGFAVTLSAGIIGSLFTALTVTRLFLGVIENSGKLKTLKMLTLVRGGEIDFLGKQKICIAISVIAILSTWFVMVGRGLHDPGRVWGVDFTGGAALTYSFKQELPIAEVRDALIKGGVAEPGIQYQQSLDVGGQNLLQIKTGAQTEGGQRPTEMVKHVMSTELARGGYQLEQEDEVGAQVGSELKLRAIKALTISMVGIIIYLWIRYELGFALGAVIALLHDVLFTVGVYVLLGRQISMPIIAALLTIVGYSVNDTIVVFDRIREDLRLDRTKPVKDVCNHAINQTLSRTLLTSFVTLLTVVSLLVFGGGAIYDFALTLFIGMVAGTFSSIYIATPTALFWHRNKRPEFRKA